MHVVAGGCRGEACLDVEPTAGCGRRQEGYRDVRSPADLTDRPYCRVGERALDCIDQRRDRGVGLNLEVERDSSLA
jgi:hypothetical protein